MIKNKFSPQQKNQIFSVIFLMVLLNWFSVKIVLPALPFLIKYFNTTSEYIQLSVTIYLIGFSISRLFWGSLAEKYGNVRVYYPGLIISIIGIIISMTSHSLTQYIIGRTLEGIGIGCLAPSSRAMLTETFEKKELSKRMIYVSVVSSSMLGISPIIGSWLIKLISWRAIFGFLLIFSILLFMFSKIKLRIINEKTVNFTYKDSLNHYITLLKDRHFWGFAIPYACATGGFIGYFSASPFWFVSQLGIDSSTFSYLLFPSVGLYIVGLLITDRMVGKYRLEKILYYGLVVGLFLLIFSVIICFFNFFSYIWIIIIMSLFGLVAGFIFPTANSCLLSRFKKTAAPASALVSTVVFLSSSIFSTITMRMKITNLIPVVIYIGILIIFAYVMYYFLIMKSDIYPKSNQ